MANLLNTLLYRPRGIKIGPRSKVFIPRWLHNKDRIEIGANCTIGRFSILNPMTEYNGVPQEGRINIGDEVYIGGFCQIHAMFTIEIGEGSVLSEHVYISDTAHGINPSAGPIMKQPLESKGPVQIGKNVFLGFGSSILPGVTLGDSCVVGTRSVVTQSFPAYSMIAGSPAKIVKTFDLNTNKWIPFKASDQES